MPPASRKMPLDAVEMYVSMYHAPDDWVALGLATPMAGQQIGIGHLSHLTGRNKSLLHRWRKTGVPYWSADEIACKLGVHPLSIWPDFYTEEELSCA